MRESEEREEDMISQHLSDVLEDLIAYKCLKFKRAAHDSGVNAQKDFALVSIGHTTRT